MTYANYNDVLQQIKGGQTSANLTQDQERAIILSFLNRASRVDHWFTDRGWRYFEPHAATITIQITPDIVQTGINRLQLPYPLLELDSATVNGAAISPTVIPPPATAGIRTPYHALYLPTTTTWYSAGCSASTNAGGLWLSIVGVWGMARNFPINWVVEDALQADINASVTTLTVADADGVNIDNETPRFSPGQLISIDDEYMRVNEVESNTLTVRRGMNGSIAAAHTSAADVSIWYTDYAVRQEFARQVAMWFSRVGAFNNVETTALGATIVFPSDLLASLRNTLTAYVGDRT